MLGYFQGRSIVKKIEQFFKFRQLRRKKKLTPKFYQKIVLACHEIFNFNKLIFSKKKKKSF